MVNRMVKTMIVIMLMRVIQINANAVSNFQHMTLARDASFDNLFPMHDHYVLDHFENLTPDLCVLYCLKRFPLCSGFLRNDELGICKVMACLLNTRFLERKDGWKFFGNGKVCESGWYPFAGHCYYLNKTAVKWRDARIQCKSQDAHLVEVNSAKENKWISETFLSAIGAGDNQLVSDAWIGARRINGTLRWLHSKSPLTYQSWVPGLPYGSGKCVLMYNTEMWIDTSCQHLYAFIC